MSARRHTSTSVGRRLSRSTRTTCLDVKKTTYGYEWQFHLAGISPSISLEEAHFWAEAIRSAGGIKEPLPAVVERLRGQEFDGDIDDARLYSVADTVVAHCVPPEAAIVVATLRGIDAVVDTLTVEGRRWDSAYANAIYQGFRIYILPYLTDEEHVRIAARVAAVIEAESFDQLRPLLAVVAALGVCSASTSAASIGTI